MAVKFRSNLVFCVCVAAVFFPVACAKKEPVAPPSPPPSAESDRAHPRFCAAIQGNGQAIFGHFHSLAHIISYHGLFDAAAGSSSASLTMFLLESMLLNPEITDCRNCPPMEKAHRVSLMLKSLVGFYEMSDTRTETDALFNYAKRLKQFEARWLRDPARHAASFDEFDFANVRNLFGELYNDRFSELFRKSRDKRFHFEDYQKSFSSGLFQVDDTKVFVRPSPITFAGLANSIGQIANFYALRRYDNRRQWADWFKACGPLEALKEKTWGEIAYKNFDPEKIEDFVKNGTKIPSACGEKFAALMKTYNAHDHSPHRATDRVEDRVGEHLSTLPITGLIVDSGVGKLQNAKEAYWNAENNIDLNLDYEREYRVGYFGKTSALNSIGKEVEARRERDGDRLDVKTGKFRALPDYKWRMVLETSPAEPSLSEAVEMERDSLYSIGGWADPFPATVLKLAHCDKVVFIASERKNFKLISDLTDLIGGKAYNEKMLATESIPGWGDSSLRHGLKDADGVWCTNWDEFTEWLSMEAVYKMTKSTFAAGLETSSPLFAGSPLARPVTKARFGCNLN